MAGLESVTGIGASRDIYVDADSLDTIETGKDGRKTVKLKNGVSVVFFPNTLAPDEKRLSGEIKVDGKYTYLYNIKGRDNMQSIKVFGTDKDDKIIADKCYSVDVEPGKGDDFINFVDSFKCNVHASNGSKGTVFGTTALVGDVYEVDRKFIPCGYEYFPRSDESKALYDKISKK